MQATTKKVGKLDCSVISYPLPGQTESGDLHVIKEHANGVLVGVVDGLGHGSEAAHAAHRAVSVLEEFSHESVISLVRRCHNELTQTRGAVMSLASFYFGDDTLTWIAVGNVEGVLAHFDSGNSTNLTHIVQRGGVVGFQLPMLHATVLPVSKGDTLILATDGIRPEFCDDLRFRETPQKICTDIGERFRRETDDSLALVIRYG